MAKKRAKRNYIIISILTLLGIVLAFCSFSIPFSINGVYYDYTCFADNISLGLDLKGGISVVYTAMVDEDDEDFTADFEATIAGLTEILNGQGYTEAVVSQQGTSSIRVEVPDVDDPETILELIGDTNALYLKTEDSADAEAFMTGDDITTAEAIYDSTNACWGVSVSFTTTGQTIFAEKTAELSSSSGTIYMYLGDTQFSAATVSETITGSSTFISGGDITDQSSAEEYALRIRSGLLAMTLEMQSYSQISATLGESALFYGLLAGAIGLLLIMLFMYLIYGDFGLIANLSLLIYVVLTMFLLQSIPFIQLTLPGIAGIILSIGMAVDANVIIFERIKDEYKAGKTFNGSIKTGFKKSITSILDANITTIIAGTCLAIFGTGSIQGFALTLLVGLVVSVFTALVITRGLLKMYIHINPDNVEKVRFYRNLEVVANEK